MSIALHLGKIQLALILLDAAVIADSEQDSLTYGDSTARAVLAYKRKRNIVNRSYQTQADNIVGKMTMASLDGEMVKKEPLASEPTRIFVNYPRSLCLGLLFVILNVAFVWFAIATAPSDNMLRLIQIGD